MFFVFCLRLGAAFGEDSSAEHASIALSDGHLDNVTPPEPGIPCPELVDMNPSCSRVHKPPFFFFSFACEIRAACQFPYQEYKRRCSIQTRIVLVPVTSRLPATLASRLYGVLGLRLMPILQASAAKAPPGSGFGCWCKVGSIRMGKEKEGHGDCITASDVSTCKSIRPWHEHGTSYMYIRRCKIDI